MTGRWRMRSLSPSGASRSRLVLDNASVVAGSRAGGKRPGDEGSGSGARGHVSTGSRCGAEAGPDEDRRGDGSTGRGSRRSYCFLGIPTPRPGPDLANINGKRAPATRDQTARSGLRGTYEIVSQTPRSSFARRTVAPSGRQQQHLKSSLDARVLYLAGEDPCRLGRRLIAPLKAKQRRPDRELAHPGSRG